MIEVHLVPKECKDSLDRLVFLGPQEPKVAWVCQATRVIKEIPVLLVALVSQDLLVCLVSWEPREQEENLAPEESQE